MADSVIAKLYLSPSRHPALFRLGSEALKGARLAQLAELGALAEELGFAVASAGGSTVLVRLNGHAVDAGSAAVGRLRGAPLSTSVPREEEAEPIRATGYAVPTLIAVSAGGGGGAAGDEKSSPGNIPKPQKIEAGFTMAAPNGIGGQGGAAPEGPPGDAREDREDTKQGPGGTQGAKFTTPNGEEAGGREEPVTVEAVMAGPDGLDDIGREILKSFRLD